MLVVVATGQAQALAHYTPMKGHVSYASKVKEYEFRADHAQDVARFFHNHPKLANTRAGRAAIWQHKKLLRWSERKLSELNASSYIPLMSDDQLAQQGRLEIRHGGTYSVRYGDCSERLKAISRELVSRAFAPYGTQSWAEYIVGRESGFCPGAVNTTYPNPNQRAQCLAQLIPAYHTWVDYKKCKSDPSYSVWVFVRLSRGGHSTGPWR